MKTRFILLSALLATLPLPPQAAMAGWADKVNQAWTSISGKEETKPVETGKAPAPITLDNDQRFLQVWDEVIARLDQGLGIVDQMAAAPESKFFGTDKKGLRKDLNGLLDDIIVLLEDQPINSYRARTVELEERIERLDQDLITFQEARVAAPKEHSFKTTREEFDDKIDEAREGIRAAEREIEEIRRQLHKRIREVGLDMSEEQVAILLSRVDADDIIQMAAIFDVTRQLTEQLMKLTAESGEDIAPARRYYGMYVVLLELTVRMQHNYLSAVNEQYLPRIGVVVEKTMALNHASQEQLKAETDPGRQEVYRKNIKAQELTLKTARLYMDNLRNQRDRVKTAVEEMGSSLALAHNTYETVQVSAELIELLRQSSSSFNALMNLQIPEIVPFENQEMLEKYQELSRIIAE